MFDERVEDVHHKSYFSFFFTYLKHMLLHKKNSKIRKNVFFPKMFNVVFKESQKIEKKYAPLMLIQPTASQLK